MKIKLTEEDIVVGNIVTNDIHTGEIISVSSDTFNVKINGKEYLVNKNSHDFYLMKKSSEIEDIILNSEEEEEIF